jgi:hypothetical protein
VAIAIGLQLGELQLSNRTIRLEAADLLNDMAAKQAEQTM